MSATGKMVRVFTGHSDSTIRQMTGAVQEKCNPEILHAKSFQAAFCFASGRLRITVA